MICVSIGQSTVEGCIEALKGLAFAEIRLDLIGPAELTEAGIRSVFSQKASLIATCRPGKMDEDERKRLLLQAIEAGAAYIDIEVESADIYKKELAAKARAEGCKVIVSYHDHKKTPPQEELKQIISWCFESGADIAKIACTVRSGQDNARLLGLLDSADAGRLVIIGMGREGMLTRIVAPLLGSPFTYASLGEGKETAEGQIGKEKLEGILKELGSLR